MLRNKYTMKSIRSKIYIDISDLHSNVLPYITKIVKLITLAGKKRYKWPHDNLYVLSALSSISSIAVRVSSCPHTAQMFGISRFDGSPFSL